MNLDYCSPDFVLDSNLNIAADMFSLGLMIIALYNSPHTSPLQANSSISTYKRLFTSSLTIPSASNSFLSSRPLPEDLTTSVLPRLITRRPAQRMSAKEFQQSSYFDNILISTIRFLDALPAKTLNEKSQFMRGLSRVLPSFPKSVLDKKVLPALLEEMKDRELLSLILQNVFKIIELLPSGRRPFTEKIIPRLREIFIPPSNTKAPPERDTAKEAGLMVLLEHVKAIAHNCSGKEFKDGKSPIDLLISSLTNVDILPIIHLAIESPTHSIVDAALRSLPVILPVLDFSTIKNELFPVIASVFTKTSSLGIKVRGLEAFVILCGGSNDSAASNDGLSGIMSENTAKKSSSTALDKYTMQEKILPLIKGIKTKEPAVAVAALNVLRQVGSVADTDFVAMDILPVLWSMSLGPLLDLKQFQSFMELIKSLSNRVETEHTKKLQELSSTNGVKSKGNDDFMSFDAGNAFGATNGSSQDPEIDFERLVKGNAGAPSTTNGLDSGWDTVPVSPRPVQNQQKAPSFAWSTPSPTAATVTNPAMNAPLRPQPGPTSRTITPDLSRFDALSPSSTQFSQPLQPHNTFSTPLQPQSQSAYQAPLQPQSQPSYQAAPLQPQPMSNYQTQSSTINWAAAAPTLNPWANPSTMQTSTPSLSSMSNLGNSMSNLSMNRPTMSNNTSSFALPPPPGQQRPGMSASSSFSLPPPPGVNAFQSSFSPPPQQQLGIGFKPPPQQQQQSGMGFGKQAQQPKKSGLDAFESLL